jgi:3-oxoacyl-[acyl-carrier protein] reductase
MILRNRKALVTGASRGIGRAIVLELAREGADISFNYLKAKDKAEELVKEVKSLKRKVLSAQVDIRDLGQVRQWVEDTREGLGGIDILVNNAGITRDKALMMMQPDDWSDVIDTNLTGIFNVTRSCIVTFMKQKKGDIVNISSVSGIVGLARQTNYATTKAGIIGFTKSLAREVSAYNIRVNAVVPGYIQTDMLDTLRDDLKEELLKNIPLNRFGRAQEVARAVVFLLSQAANYITGQLIQIDGGLAIR